MERCLPQEKEDPFSVYYFIKKNNSVELRFNDIIENVVEATKKALNSEVSQHDRSISWDEVKDNAETEIIYELEEYGYSHSKSDTIKNQVEKDVKDLIGVEEPDKPVVLDLESIRILKPGKYELDLVHLFKKDPLVFKLEEGKYIIDLPEAFRKMEK